MAIVGVAFTKKGREQKILQHAVKTTGKDPKDLKVETDERSGTSRVVDKRTGRTVGGVYTH